MSLSLFRDLKISCSKVAQDEEGYRNNDRMPVECIRENFNFVHIFQLQRCGGVPGRISMLKLARAKRVQVVGIDVIYELLARYLYCMIEDNSSVFLGMKWLLNPWLDKIPQLLPRP